MKMGWGDCASCLPCLSDPERDLRRAVGGPQAVSLVDVELDPERWHRHFITTIGAIGWQGDRLGRCRLGGCGSIAAWNCLGDGFRHRCRAEHERG